VRKVLRERQTRERNQRPERGLYLFGQPSTNGTWDAAAEGAFNISEAFGLFQLGRKNYELVFNLKVCRNM